MAEVNQKSSGMIDFYTNLAAFNNGVMGATEPLYWVRDAFVSVSANIFQSIGFDVNPDAVCSKSKLFSKLFGECPKP